MPLRIALLGPPEVEINGRRMVVDTRKAIAVLAYLACARGPVPRDTLGLLLWPDSSQDRARAALRRTLSALRKGLGDGVLQTNRITAWLALPADSTVDVDRFEAILDGDEDSSPMGSLQTAVDLYRGDFMAGFAIRDSSEFDDWQRQQAGHFRRLTAEALDRLANERSEAGMLSGAVDAAARRLDLDTLHEPAHRRLMMLHAAAGDRPSAVRQYRECVRVLDEELGVPPLDETTDLYRRILDGSDDMITEREIATRADVDDFDHTARPALVGRDENLASLMAAYASATHAMQVVEISGEAGIGKSRLLEEFVGSLPPRARVVRTVSYQGQAAIPHGVTVALLRDGLDGTTGQMAGIAAASLAEASRLVGEIAVEAGEVPEPPPIDSPGGYQRLLEGCAGVLVGMAESQLPGLLLIDDAHWTDDDSLRMLAMLVRRFHDKPVLVAVAYRSGEVAADHPLAVVVREAQRSGILTSVALDRLDGSDVAELVGRLLPDHVNAAAEIYRLSEGVPLFVVEYLALLRAEGHLREVPMGVRDLIVDQVARRSQLGRQLLDAAAVVGKTFDFRILHATAGRSEEEMVEGLEELMRAGLVRQVPAAGSLDFDHDHVRRFVYESMSLVRRRLLHGRVADALLDVRVSGDVGLEAAAVVGHLQAAGRDREAAEQHVAAAEGAAKLYANDQALRHYEAALALGYGDAPRLREAIGDLQTLAGDYASALANLQAAAVGFEGVHRAALEHKLGVVYTRAGDWELAEASFASAEQGLADDGRIRPTLFTDWAWLAHRRGDTPRSRDLANQALAEASRLGDHIATAQAHNVMGIVERSRNPEAAVAHHEQSRLLTADLDEPAYAAALNNLALSLEARGEPGAGLAFAEESLAITERLGDRHKAAAVHSNIADLLHALGREDEAMRHLRLSAEAFADVGRGPEHLEPAIWTLSDW